MAEDACNDKSSFSKGVVVLKFTKKDLSRESKQWLINKLTQNLPNGLPGLQCEPLEGPQDSTYCIWAGDSRLVNASDVMGLKRESQEPGLAGLESLTTTDKQRIALHEMESIRFQWDDLQPEDLPDFYKDQVIYSKCKSDDILTYFPVHNPDTLKRLNEIWVKKIFSDLPIDEIHCYFGDGVAMYFSFLSFYTKWLFPPALIGLLFHLVSLFVPFNITGYFCLFNVVWSSIFFVLWRRKSTVLAHKWGSLNYSKFDEPRPEFKGEKIETDPITKKVQPVCGYKSKYYRFYFVSLPIIFIFLCLSLSLGLAYFWIEDYIRWFNHPYEGAFGIIDPWYYRSQPLTWPLWCATILLVSTYCVLLYILDIFYRRVAYNLNNWENHRLQTNYDNFLIAKLVVFNFVNYYNSLFYVAFYLKDFELLQKNLITLLITWQVIQQLQEAVLPYFKYKATMAKYLGPKKEGGEEDLDFQIKKDLAKDEYPNTLDDFLEMFFQFGYVFLFSAVFPSASFWALLNNLTEVRTDGFKLLQIFRKPFPRQCDGIGTWLVAFELLGAMAVITNCSLISMNVEVKEYFLTSFDLRQVDIFLLFVVIEHTLLFIKAAILYLVPSTPNWIKVQVAEKEYRAQQAIIEEINKNLSQKTEKYGAKKNI